MLRLPAIGQARGEGVLGLPARLLAGLEVEPYERLRADGKRRGVEVEGPVFHEWMAATSLYFEDPDGHALELCATPKREG